MRRTLKYLAAASVAGMLAIGMSIPSQAWQSRTHAARGVGAGAAVGAAAANAYAPGYAYGSTPMYGYGYAPGPYASAPSSGPSFGYTEPGYGAYAYAPAPGMAYQPGYDAYAAAPYYAGPSSVEDCATEGSYGKGLDYAACGY